MGASSSGRDKRLWLFNCANTFTGNPKWLFWYVNNFRPEIEAWWIASDADTVATVRRLGFKAVVMESRRGRALQSRAGVWVVNQVKEVIPPELAGAVLLNLWHGVGVKGIERGMNEGYLRERIIRKHIVNAQAYHDCQLFLATSPAMEAHFSKQIGLQPDRIVRGGYPQNVYTGLHGAVSTFDHDLLARRGLSGDTRIALFAPTPRREFGADFLIRAFPDIPSLIDTLRRENILLVLKMHPHMTADPAFRRLRERHADEPHLMFWDNDEDVYEVFHKVDIAIVDYSSILYDLLAAGVTEVIRYVFDFDFEAAAAGGSGNAVIEPGVDYLGLSCGAIAKDFDELLTRLGEDCTVPAAELTQINDHFWSYSDDATLERIVDRALEFEPTHEPLPTFYSFDVFDTVIARRAVEPDGVFFRVRHRIEQESGFSDHLTANFPRLRAEAESNVRENRRKHPAHQETLDFEITFDEIYARLADLHNLDDRQVARLQQWELDAELADVVPIPKTIARIRDLVDAGETVVLISDQYLPVAFVRRLLETADPLLAELPLYLSNDRGRLQKSTKQLYLNVFQDQDWTYGRWEHTGDNERADIKRAGELGIRTKQVRTPTFLPFERRLVTAVPTYDARLVAGAMRAARTSGLTKLERFAHSVVALYLAPYVGWAIDDALARGYRTLYFISRDGHHMKSIADAIIAERGLEMRTKYIYGSRRAWRLASQANGVGAETFSGYGSFAGAQTVAEISESADLTVVELAAMVPETRGYDPTERLTRKQMRSMLQHLGASEPFREHLTAKAHADRELAVAYLRQEMDFAEPFGVVEYWGRGYTQDCLVTLVEQAAGRPLPTPFYYARSIYLSDGNAIRHNFTSSTHSMLFVEAIFANLPYGTVEGYRREGNRVVPVTSPREYDAELFAAMESQLPRFAADLARLPLLDRDRVRRELHAFAFDDFDEFCDAPLYVDRIAHLRDAVTLGGAEGEFAPKLTIRIFRDFMVGKRRSELTRSMPMSRARSSALPVKLFHWRRKYDWPRWIPREERKPDDPRRWRRVGPARTKSTSTRSVAGRARQKLSGMARPLRAARHRVRRQ